MSASYSAYDSDIAAIARLLSDRTRAALLTALLDGRPLAAGELARLAGVSPATASAHLARLLDGDLVTVIPQGRHRYYALSRPEVAHVLEVIATISPPTPVRGLRQSREARLLAAARTCYDHLAGQAGVTLLTALLDKGALVAVGEAASVPGRGGYEITESGTELFTRFGVDVVAARTQRRQVARSCLDRTERQAHLGGALGASITARLLQRGWFVRGRTRRALHLTEAGRDGLVSYFGCLLDSRS